VGPRLITAGASVLYGSRVTKRMQGLPGVRREPRHQAYVTWGPALQAGRTARIYSDIGFFTSDETSPAIFSRFST